MSKLTRVIQKIFGETAGVGEFGVFGSNAASPPGTNSKDLTLIQSLSQYLAGWFSATASAAEPPRIEDRNSLDLLWSSQLAYLFQNGLAEWQADTKYYLDVSFVQVDGSIYQAVLGDDVTNDNTNKTPGSNPLWWKLISQLEAVSQWDVAEAVVYETAGAIVERFGQHYAASGKASNLGKDPADPQSDSWWIPSKGWDKFKDMASEGISNPGGMHPWTDFSSGDYQQNIKLDEIIRGGVTYDVYGVILDGTQVTLDATLEAIFDPSGAKEYPWINEFAPDSLGTRTLIDMRGRSTRGMTAGGGVAATLAEVQEDAGQRITGYIQKEAAASGDIGGVLTEDGASTLPIGRGLFGTGDATGRLRFDNSLSTSPNTAKTNDVETRIKALVRGVDYIIVIIAQ